MDTPTIHSTPASAVSAPSLALPSRASLIEAGDIIPGSTSTYASRVVFAKLDNTVTPYATWLAVYPDDGKPYCTSGHYHRSLADASADYTERQARGY